MFYRLALEYPDAATDKSARCAALRALSDIAYESESYTDCLSKGKECFQASPVKSEVSVKNEQNPSCLIFLLISSTSSPVGASLAALNFFLSSRARQGSGKHEETF